MKRHSLLCTFGMLASVFSQMACSTKTVPLNTDLTKEHIIPKPVSVAATGNAFTISGRTDICIPKGSAPLKQIGEYLAGKLRTSTGFPLNIKETSKKPGRGDIFLLLTEDESGLGDEGYVMEITEKSLIVKAYRPAGIFYGIQTFRQLLPPRVEMASVQEGPWHIATGTIRDYPAYAYRGTMLDVARHFFPPEPVKNYIDKLAAYKINRLHLHLSDDQGWRIEIKSWPNLTLHGATTQVGGGRGGFYTQEEYSSLVRYASERFITIIPEIDMPGHTNAALSSYAELNADGKAPGLYTGTRVGFSSLAAGKEITYRFVEDVLRELAALTPGPSIHIGGDESHSTKTEDYILFVNRVQDIVARLGKQITGWDDIARASLRPNSIVQYWENAGNAVKGVNQGAKVIMSLASCAYLDMKYDSASRFGLNWAGYIETDKAYNWDPAGLVPGIGREHIAGIEAPLWSETVTTLTEAEYLIFPRLPGYAEIGWTPTEIRNWDEYRIRLAAHGPRMKAMNINFYPSPQIDWNLFESR